MKTDDRTTRQRDEAEGDEAKVVRLSDWLAPEDELVPFGPRAYASTGSRAPVEGTGEQASGMESPAASGFWDGDTSVHTAVPGPGIFDKPDELSADSRRYRRHAPVWRPALPALHPSDWSLHARDRLALADLRGWIPWRWAAAGAAFAVVALIVVVITLGTSASGRRDTAAQASLGDPSPAALSGTLGDVGTATRTAAVSDLRRLPPVDVAVRTIGAARLRAGALQARPRRHVVVAPAPASSSSTTARVETPTATEAVAPAETTPAPSETEPAQATSNATPTTGDGGSSSSGGASSSGSQKQSSFGASGSLGPGSSPNG